MQRVWLTVMLASTVYSIITSRGSAAAAEVMAAGEHAVTLMLTLVGTMTLWSGMMEILSATGDVARLSRGLRRVAQPLFRGLKNGGCWDAIGMNIAANLLGLGNAATPAGIEAAQRLKSEGAAGMSALSMLVVINSTGLQLIPTTVTALRQAAGSRQPADIWLPVMAASVISTAAGIASMLIIQRLTSGRRAE